jgi:hypothetical protein
MTSLAHLIGFPVYTLYANSCTMTLIFSLFVPGNFVVVVGVLFLQYLKTMPLQLINRLTTETFHVFISSRKRDHPRCSFLMHNAWFNTSYLLYYHHPFKQDGSIMVAAGDACAYCWDVVCIFLM